MRTSHRMMLLSADALASVVSSELQARPMTHPLWPFRVARSAPVAASHRRIERSPDPEAKVAPSGLEGGRRGGEKGHTHRLSACTTQPEPPVDHARRKAGGGHTCGEREEGGLKVGRRWEGTYLNVTHSTHPRG